MATEVKHCVTYLLLLKHGSFFAFEKGENNQTRLTSYVVCEWQKTGIEKICTALERVSNVVSYKLKLLVLNRNTKNYEQEMETVVNPVH